MEYQAKHLMNMDELL